MNGTAESRQQLPIGERHGLREVMARRIAPGAAHQPIEQQLHDIDQHEAGQNLIGAEAVLEEGRNRGPGHAARHTQRQHDDEGERRLPFRKEHRDCAADDGAGGELALGPDVPDIGQIGDRQTGADQGKGCCFDGELLKLPEIVVLPGPEIFDRVEEIDAQRLERIETLQREDDGASDDGERDGDDRRQHRHLPRMLAALFKQKPHGSSPLCVHAPRPSAGRSAAG